LKFIDNYYDLGINKFNRLHWFPATDGVHHNVLGAELIAAHIASELF
jgi:lysophospholipase L1-like esterase